MHLDELLDTLATLPRSAYRAALVAALIGPPVARLLGLGGLARLVRPLALALLLAGMYARQRAAQAAAARAGTSAG
ncbi:hypothetical protein [Kallotenue papyrolyticum]|uniref:hypothetical protein n=1 Tax=Kallotenue papyrolyticum TaxID=1325125 RepID=UPI000492B743|nr:hypothetical protein [Kallotenue papyrolyticum]